MDDRDPVELDALLTWLRAPDVGSARLAALLERFGSARAALRAGPGAWRACKIPPTADAWLAAPDRERLAADRAWLAAPTHRLIVLGDADYPPQLARGLAPPAALFVDGDADLLWRAQVAVVGSRHATPDGLAAAADFATALAEAGLAITSGLAAGIDGAAHRAALDARGATIAVCGTGVDVCYPRRHRGLRDAIVAHGAVVSEYPLGTPCAADQFPRRNRIIAALALGTLVVEAGLESGSLITARLATEQGREVLAIPGSIHSPVKRGCHRLIRDGAKLVETAQDVLDELGPLARELGAALRRRLDAGSGPSARATSADETPRPSAPAAPAAPARGRACSAAADAASARQLLGALGHDPLGVDALAARSGLTVAAVSSMLLALELDGVVTALPGGRYARSTSPVTR